MADDPLQHLRSVDIDVSDPSIEGYQSVMDWMFDRYRTRAGLNSFRGIPINSDDPGWFRINLIFPDKPTVSLVIDEINCYLISFRRGNGDWMIFEGHILPDEVEGISLGFDSNYRRLCKEVNRNEMVFGLQILTNAYHVLVSYDGDLKRVKKALVQLIMMFCEAFRFVKLRRKMLEIMGHSLTLPVPNVMWSWTTSWSNLCSFALDCRKREVDGVMEDSDELLAGIAGLDVNNREDVAQLLGLIIG